MPDLFLHVGHHKTGSSFIQSTLAASIAALSEYDIFYPAQHDREVAATGEVSEGNGERLLKHLDITTDRYHCEYRPSQGSGSLASAWEGAGRSTLLFSREQFFFELTSPAMQERLEAFREVGGFQNLRILLFTRNPVAHATSIFLQKVKTSGLVDTIEEYFETYDFPGQVERLLEAYPSAEFTVCNYSVVRKQLLEVLSDWLGVPAESLRVPPTGVVNRSITRAELEFLRALNAVRGVPSNFLSRPLTDQLPDVAKEDLRPGMDTQEALWNRLEPVISRLNSRLGTEGQYDSDIAPCRTPATSTLPISKEQLEIMARTLGQRIITEQKRTALAKAKAHFFKGKLEQNKGRTDESVRAYRKAIEFDPEYVPAMVSLVGILLDGDSVDEETRGLFERAVSLDPGNQSVQRLQARWNQSSLPQIPPGGGDTKPE